MVLRGLAGTPAEFRSGLERSYCSTNRQYGKSQAKLQAANTLDAIMLGKPLVEHQPVGIEQVDDRKIIENQLAEKPFALRSLSPL